MLMHATECDVISGSSKALRPPASAGSSLLWLQSVFVTLKCSGLRSAFPIVADAFLQLSNIEDSR